MASRRREGKPRSVAHLVALRGGGKVVIQQNLPLSKYYEGPNELIDSGEFRRDRGITRISGKLYNAKGKLIQEFDNQYSGDDGRYLHGKIRYEDGTVSED